MSNGKIRIPVPPSVADAILFAADRTCCKCRIAGRPVQIHHIDDDPANNAPDNLAVLCLECHNETLINGGFARRLTANQIVHYRDDWSARVLARRNDADRLAAEAMAVTPQPRPIKVPDGAPDVPDRTGLIPPLRSLPEQAIRPECILPLHRPRQDWAESRLRGLLDNSGLDLIAIDRAVLSWHCPFVQSPEDWGWRKDQSILFSVKKDLFDPELPLDLQQIVTDCRHHHHNEPDSVRYCVKAFQADTRDAGGRLRVDVQPITYFAAYAIMEVLMEERSSRNEALRSAHFSRLHGRAYPFTPNTLDIQVLVVTGDKKILLARRRDDEGLHFMRGCWSATLEEQLNAPWSDYLEEERVFKEALIPDETAFSAFRRSLREELHLDDKEIGRCGLRILGAGFEYDSFGTSLYAMAELPKELTFSGMYPRLLAHEEFDAVACCPFEVKYLLPAFETSSLPQRIEIQGRGNLETWKWHSSSRLRLLLGLMRLVGVDAVKRWMGGDEIR